MAIKAVIENARKVHIVEHEIARPEASAAQRVQSAWMAGAMLPPRHPDASSHRALAPREPQENAGTLRRRPERR